MKNIISGYLIILLQAITSCYQKAEPETYLIPSFYTGKVNILFNQTSIPVKYTNEYNKDTIYISNRCSDKI